MKIIEEKFKEFNVIKLSGNFEMLNIKQFQKIMDKYIETGIKNIIIDLKELIYMDSSAIGISLYYSKKFKENGKFYLINVPNSIYELFVITSVVDIISIFNSYEEVI